MNLNPFDYKLDDSMIAQRPADPAESANLMFIDKSSNSIKTDTFFNINSFLTSDDVLVFNNTAVKPSRLIGKLQTGAAVEFLIVKNQENNKFLCLAKPLRKLKENTRVVFSKNLEAVVLKRTEDNYLLVEMFLNDSSSLGLSQEIKKTALMPIPPYIRKGIADNKDITDYQPMFAKYEGSIASPTASLHFTENLIKEIKTKIFDIKHLTLHLGVSSFKPIFDEDNNLNVPSSEEVICSKELINQLLEYKKQNKNIIAVGTTVVRALESAARGVNSGATDLFIKPGFDFKVVDGLITNFHQPKTTHMLLVQALMGRELLKESYDLAIKNQFKFLSYGDGMLIK